MYLFSAVSVNYKQFIFLQIKRNFFFFDYLEFFHKIFNYSKEISGRAVKLNINWRLELCQLKRDFDVYSTIN